MTDMISAADCSAAVYEASSSMFLVDVALGSAFGFVLGFAVFYGLWSFLYTRYRYPVMRRHIQTFREWRRELELREKAIEAREKEAGI